MSEALHYRVQKKAYELWEADGRPNGRDLTYWITARQQVLAEPQTLSDDSDNEAVSNKSEVV